MDPSGRARRLPVETGVENGGMVGSSGRTGGFLSGDGSGGAIPRNRFPLTFGGTGGTSVLGTGPWAPTFRPVDPYFAREEHAARFETVRTDWDMRGRSEDTSSDRQNSDNNLSRTLVRELIEQNQQQEEDRREDRRRAECLQQQLVQALNNIVGQVTAAPQQPRGERKLDDVAMAQISEFYGRRDEYATEWVEQVDEVATSYNWTDGQRRRAAVSKLRASARDWYVACGQGAFEEWDEWREAFLEAFGCTLTLNQWMAQVMGKVRRENETMRSYCYSKIKICMRFPLGVLPESEVVRYLTLGMNNPQAESFILTSRARTIDDFFIAIREWEEFALDREPSPSQYTPSMPVAVPIATRAEHEPLTPTLVASLIKRFETQGQVAEVGARSKPAAPVSPGNSLFTFQHPHQQATFRPPANAFPQQGAYNNQGTYRPLATQPPPRRPSVQFAPDPQVAQPAAPRRGGCFRCGQMDHRVAHCPINVVEDQGRYHQPSSGNA